MKLNVELGDLVIVLRESNSKCGSIGKVVEFYGDIFNQPTGDLISKNRWIVEFDRPHKHRITIGDASLKKITGSLPEHSIIDWIFNA